MIKNISFIFNIKNLNTILINFVGITIAYFISAGLREGLKVYIEKLFIKDIITKEKRTKPFLYFFDYLGYFLFLVFGIGYSNNRNIRYKNYSFKRKFIFLISGIIMDFIIIFFILFLMNKDFYFNKFLFIHKLYFYLIYINFIFILLNILPFPFSDLMTFINLNSYFFPLLYIFQIVFIILLYYFHIHSILYLKFINYIKIYF